MNSRKRTTRYTLLLMRLAVVALAFMLGHDALLAMDPHGADVDISTATLSHHSTMLEQCGSTNATMQQSGSVPAAAQIDVTPAPGAPALMDSHTCIVVASVAPAPDSSIIRVSYQVFLN